MFRSEGQCCILITLHHAPHFISLSLSLSPSLHLLSACILCNIALVSAVLTAHILCSTVISKYPISVSFLSRMARTKKSAKRLCPLISRTPTPSSATQPGSCPVTATLSKRSASSTHKPVRTPHRQHRTAHRRSAFQLRIHQTGFQRVCRDILARISGDEQYSLQSTALDALQEAVTTFHSVRWML
jgi:hypothetical protein